MRDLRFISLASALLLLGGAQADWTTSIPIFGANGQLTCGHAYGSPACAGDEITFHVLFAQQPIAEFAAGGCFFGVCSAPIIFTFQGADYVLADSCPLFTHEQPLFFTVGPFTLSHYDIEALEFNLSVAQFWLSDDGVGLHQPSFTQAFTYAAYGDAQQFFPIQCSDINRDGVVDAFDLGQLLKAWGTDAGCDGDLNRDGAVDGLDLGILLSEWTI